MKSLGFSLLALALCAGCGAHTTYQPGRVAAGELTLRYDEDAFRVVAADRQIAESPRYGGLPEFVACVPKAHEHAQQAASWGTTSTALSWLTVGLAATGVGGLAGLAYRDEDRGTMAALLLGGLLVETAAIVVGATSIGARARAHGNALDAVNYYNDAVGFSGGNCASPPTASAPR